MDEITLLFLISMILNIAFILTIWYRIRKDNRWAMLARGKTLDMWGDQLDISRLPKEKDKSYRERLVKGLYHG